LAQKDKNRQRQKDRNPDNVFISQLTANNTIVLLVPRFVMWTWISLRMTNAHLWTFPGSGNHSWKFKTPSIVGPIA